MSTLNLTLPEFAFIVVTRGALGAGLGFLLSGRISEAQRRAVGLALVGFGIVTTIPAAMAVFGGRQRDRLSSSEAFHGHEIA